MFITNKNISESLVRSLQNSFTSQTNCEITLMCEGKTLKCHRHVLVLHSTHFNNLFKEQNEFPKAIAVVNMKFTHLKAMVDYMYFGRIKLQEDNDEMKQIIKCAEDLGLSALVSFINDFIKSSSKFKASQLNGSGANLSSGEINGDDSLLKRKRASDLNTTVKTGNDSFKKPKLNESGPKSSTPLREPSKANNKPTVASDVKVSNSDNSETMATDKKKKSGDDEADDEETKRRARQEEEEKKRRAREEDDRKKRKEEEERKRKEEEDRKRREEEAQRIEEETKRKKADEEKRRAAEEKRKANEEAERIRMEDEKKKKAMDKKKEEEAAARKAEEERSKKETTKCDESASTKSCAVCNKQYKDNIDHRKVLEGITFEKKCIMNGCSKALPFRRALIDHLLKQHKIDVCDG